MKDKYKKITIMLLWSTAAIWIAWDITAVLGAGGDATISRVIFNSAYVFAFIPYAFGVLMGHFFWNTDREWNLKIFIRVSLGALLASFLPVSVHPMVALIFGVLIGHYYWGLKKND